MLNMIKKQFKLRKEEIVFAGIIEFVTFILGMIVLAVIMKYDDTTNKAFELGTIIAFFTSLLTIFTMVFATFRVSFNNAICMGRTRKSFVISYTVVTFCITCVAIIVGFFFGFIEKSIYIIIYPNHVFEYVAMNHITPIIVVAVILVEVIVPIFIGTLLAKYGQKAFWIMWIFWMFGFTVLPRMLKNIYENDSFGLGDSERKLIAALGGIGTVSWYVIGGIILLIMLVTTINLIRKQGVKIP